MIRFHFSSRILEDIAIRRSSLDPVPELLDKLAGVEKVKSGWQCKCPAHEDDTASLSVSRGDDGRALVFCHAGCSAESICRALGIALADLMSPTNGHDNPAKAKTAPKAIALYDYHDEAGAVLFQIVRYEPKKFKRRRPDGKGGWIWDVEGVRNIPFHLDKIAGSPGRTTIVAEGEKDVLSLETIGVLATCNAGGAGKWTDEHAATLAGRTVIILPDNDPPGRDHGQKVARSLDGIAKSIRVVELPNLPAKGDVSDWIAAGGTKEQLLDLANATPEWTGDPPKPPPAEQYKPEPKTPPRRIEVVHAREFATHDYRPTWLVNRILVAGQPAICGGRSKAMKTSNLVDLAISIGTGTPFLGKFDTTRSTVAILSGESGAFTIQETAHRVARARGVDLADADIYFGFHLPQITRMADVDATLVMLEQTTAKVLIVDPAYLCVLGGDTAGRQATNVFDMGPLLLRLSELGEKTGSTIIMCHHCRKGPGMTGDRYDPPDLEELSMAGFAEWARQWILIGRREAFEAGSGLHRLWMNVGGSVGFSGTWSVDIDEGVLADDFTGRKWDVTVGTLDDAREEKENLKEKRENKKRDTREWNFQQRIIKAMRLRRGSMTTNQIREDTGLNSKLAAEAILAMRQKGQLEESTVLVRGKETPAYTLVESDFDATQQVDTERSTDEPQRFDFGTYS
jgi:hypothetical protein